VEYWNNGNLEDRNNGTMEYWRIAATAKRNTGIIGKPTPLYWNVGIVEYCNNELILPETPPPSLDLTFFFGGT
jgi:hypothetical protein